MEQFTASEVRDLAKRGTDAMQQFIDGRHTLHIPPQYDDADMVIAECLRAMDAFADLLEAREREDSRSLNLNAIVSATRGALAAHSAQAQPPAVSVPEVTGLTWEPPNVTVDVERVGRFRSGDEHIVRVTFRSSDDGRRMTCFYAANESAVGYLHAMLAAQENPNGV